MESGYIIPTSLMRWASVYLKPWNPPRKKVKVEESRQGIKLNCWAAISENGATKFHIYKETLETRT